MHWDGEVLQVEPGFAEEAIAAVARERPVNVWDVPDIYFGGAHTVDGNGRGAGDPRRAGASVTVDPAGSTDTD